MKWIAEAEKDLKPLRRVWDARKALEALGALPIADVDEAPAAVSPPVTDGRWLVAVHGGDVPFGTEVSDDKVEHRMGTSGLAKTKFHVGLLVEFVVSDDLEAWRKPYTGCSACCGGEGRRRQDPEAR